MIHLYIEGEFNRVERSYGLVELRVWKSINLHLRTVNWIVTFESVGLTFTSFLIIDYLRIEPVRLVFPERKYSCDTQLESVFVNQVKSYESIDIEYSRRYKSGIRA